jgi:hypothetical protein
LVEACKKFDFAVLVLSPDDLITKRGSVRPAARDNVLFEAGLFMGSLGQERTFLVYCRDDNIDLPSDLAGITIATYRRRKDGNMRAGISSVAVKIREAINKVQKKAEQPRPTITSLTTDTMKTVESYAKDSYFCKYICDLLESVVGGISGIGLEVRDKTALSVWSGNLLGMLRDLYRPKQSDVYTAWLRPTIDDPKKLSVFDSRNLKDDYRHYEYHLGEGLAGKVWSMGIPAAISELRQHPWWVFREGCDNVSYICVPVGKAAGSGGVLSVGSDLGFVVEDYDIEVVKIFASILSLRLGSENDISTNGNLTRPTVS